MEVNRIGPTVVYEPDSRKPHHLDIVLVHGLFGHPKKTWSLKTFSNASKREPRDRDLSSVSSDETDTENQPQKKRCKRGGDLRQEVFWPRDLLPKAFPQARILTWGYDVQIEGLSTATSQASLFHHSENLLSDLVMLRKSDAAKVKPLIFIAHSLGGIVVKDALSLSGNESTVFNAVLPATIGVMFLGTPHHGSRAASLGRMVFEVSKLFFKKPNLQVLRGLETNSETLERISRSFGQILSAGRIKVHSFREELPTHGVMVVDSGSSTIGYLHETRGSLHANHRNLARFSSMEDIKFQRVVSVLQDWIEESLEKQHNQQHFQSVEKDPALPDGLVFDEQLGKCLESLHSPEAQTRFEDIEPAYSTTYNWLFDHQVGFEDWLEGKNKSNTYWIQGKPGSGKSTLMKYAINHHLTRKLLSKYNDNIWVVAGFFFHDRGTTVQKSAEGFLREVLYHLIHHQKQLFVLIYPIFARILEKRAQSIDSSRSLIDEWTLGVLRDALELIGRESTNEVSVCLFVDALDEHYGNHRELILMLRSIAQLTNNPAFRVRLALAGRPENVFKTAFQGCPGFSIHEHTTDDIRHYAEDRIQAEMPRGLSIEYEEALKNLVESIVRKAQGVFLWVRLVVGEIIEGICEGDTMEELTSSLLTIPTELGELYKRALRRSSRGSLEALTRNRIEAYVMFQMASCARNPFSLHEFLAATHFLTAGKGTYPCSQGLCREQMERRLDSRSAGLLEASKKGEGLVQFIHQTVKEFLTSGDGKIIIREGLSDRRLESGFSLIYRYGLKLFGNIGWIGDFIAPNCLIKDFAYYASVLEWNEEKCVADSFEPTILQLPEQLQYNILRKIHAGTYHLSMQRYMLRERRNLLEAAVMVKYHGRGSAQIFQILTDEGVFGPLFEDDPPHVKGEMIEMIRKKLSVVEGFSKFNMEFIHLIEEEPQGGRSNDDHMELFGDDKVCN